LRGISPKGELALVKNTIVGNFYAPTGTLAVAPYSGGTPRDLDEKIAFVDWSSSNEMAVVRATDHGFQLEYPAGTVLYRTAGYISQPRISPSGDAVAFLDHSEDNNSGVVALVDRKGNKRVLSPHYAAADGLAWEPHGKEVWFTAASQGHGYSCARSRWREKNAQFTRRRCRLSCSTFRATDVFFWPTPNAE